MSNSTSNYDYNQIVNPETNRTVNTNSRTGKKVLEKYKTLLNVSQQGGVNQIHARDWRNIYRTNAYKKNKISIRDKYGKEYVGLFLNGANWNNESKNKDLYVCEEIVKSNNSYLSDSNKWRFTSRGSGNVLNSMKKCEVILPKKAGCYSMILIDPSWTYQSEAPAIVGYIIATNKTSNSGEYEGVNFIYIDYLEVSTDCQGQGICQPMLSSIINIFITNLRFTSFKIFNASHNIGAARKCYIRAAESNGLNIYHIPYHESQGNFPVHLCGLCELKENREGGTTNLDNDLVNHDGVDGEDYYMVPAGLLEEARGFDYPDCYYLYSD